MWSVLGPRLNIELDLQSLFGLHVHSCNHWLRPPQHPPPLPRIWAHIRGRYRSAKIANISLRPLCILNSVPGANEWVCSLKGTWPGLSWASAVTKTPLNVVCTKPIVFIAALSYLEQTSEFALSERYMTCQPVKKRRLWMSSVLTPLYLLLTYPTWSKRVSLLSLKGTWPGLSWASAFIHFPEIIHSLLVRTEIFFACFSTYNNTP
jgi:hypothetical protein